MKRLDAAGPMWPAEFERFDPDRAYRYCRDPERWGRGELAFHLHGAQVAKDAGMGSAVILWEIQLGTPSLRARGDDDDDGGMVFVRQRDGGPITPA
ncbi:MAG TPA: hypothetical protein VMU34_07935 [Mycobacterium sp.]|nr:hypothetical protein [Mycobacterium sp.]